MLLERGKFTAWFVRGNPTDTLTLLKDLSAGVAVWISSHHAGSGNFDRRGIRDVDTLTVCEYLALPTWGRLRYRLYRHPLIMFGLGRVYLFFMQYRIPFGLMRAGSHGSVP